MSNLIIIYIPVLHAGYEKFLKEHSQIGDVIYLLDGGYVASNFPELEKLNRDLSSVDPLVVRAGLIQIFGDTRKFRILNQQNRIDLVISDIVSRAGSVIMHDDDISSVLLENIDTNLRLKVILKKSFLRWDKNASLLEKSINVPVISSKDLPNQITDELIRQMEKSFDWWRQVACVVFDKNYNIILAAYNRHNPSDLALNIFGDPRFNFKPGEHIENCSAIHAEAWVIAQAAREGISLKGMNILVSDFPCPVCAKSIAEVEFKNLLYVRGYSKVDGQKTLEDRGVNIQKIVFEQ